LTTLLQTPPSTARKSGPDRVELILSQLEKLPAPSPVAAKLLSVSSSDDASLAAIVEVLRTDAALSAGILRLANRADLGIRSAKFDIHKAVTMLGLRRVRNAVIAQQFFRILEASPNSPAAEVIKQLWKHNLAVGCACEAILEARGLKSHERGLSAGEAFICGLLHDIGKLALAVSLPKSYARVVELCNRLRLTFCDAEHDVLGVDHTIAGKRLATRWGLPAAVVECIWFHHQGVGMLPASVKFADAIHVVQLADAAMNRAGFGAGAVDMSASVEAPCRVLGLEPNTVDSIVEKAIQRLRPLCELAEIDLDLDPAAQIARLTEANRELGRQNSELIASERSHVGRSRCLDAIAAFINVESDGFTIGDVCTAGARAFESMGATSAVGFVRRIDDEYLLVGDANRCDVLQTSSIEGLSVSARLTEASPEVHGSNRRPGEVVAAPKWAREIHRGFAGSAAIEALWFVADASKGAECGVIFEVRESSLSGWNADGSNLGLLMNLFSRTALAAFEHSDSQRLAEDALDMNRRLHAAQKDLLRIRSLDMIAQMAAGAAHEVNNPLSVISGRAQMMRTKTADEEMQRGLDVIVDQAKRASGIVTELMRFSKPGPPTSASLPLREMLDTICQRWCASMNQPVSAISIVISEPTIAVFADPTQLREIMEALLTNALEASEGTPNIQINSDSRSSDDTVRITVTDRGRGMTLETLEHALDPFYSNRPAGRGRGLGLSRAYRLVESNGGRLWIDSKVNIGTTVTLELPARAATD